MRTSTLFATSLAFLLSAAPAAFAGSADDTLEDRIEARLKANKLGHVDVDVENGIVTLKGEVATPAEKARAQRLAKVKGVTTLTNELEVDADKAKARIEERADAKKESIEKAAEAKKEAVEQNAEARKEAVERRSEAAKEHVDMHGTLPPAPTAERKTNDRIDPLVTAKVKVKFAADDLVKAHQINVDSERDGVVTLRGTVQSEAAHRRAVEIAKATEGVRQVNDLIKVGP